MSWLVDFGAMKNGYFKRETIKNAYELQKFVDYFCNTDVYKGCYYKYDHLMYGNFYLDFDCDMASDFDAIKEETLDVYQSLLTDFSLTHECIHIYFSGAKGFHLIIPAYNLGFRACKDLNKSYRKLALYYKKQAPKIDTKIYDDRRVFRLANSINSKTGFYKIQLAYNELVLMSYEAICKLAANQRPISCFKYITQNKHLLNKQIHQQLIALIDNEEKAKRSLQAQVFDHSLLTKEVIFPCIERLLNDIHGEGERNKRLIIIASHLMQKGVTEEEVREFLIDWNQLHFAPPLDENEVSLTVKSAKHQLDQGRRYGCHAILEIGYCDLKCEYINREGNK